MAVKKSSGSRSGKKKAARTSGTAVKSRAKKTAAAEQLKRRAAKILAILKKAYPGATTALEHRNALELLVATMLSAQCTDERVNMVTRDLFKSYKTAADYANADPAELEQQIRTTGFFRQKARAIQAACRQIVEKHNGRVPKTMEQLTALPGVARKTANVVLGTAYGINAGIVVDTHVGRVAVRLGLTTTKNSKDAARIERDLMELIPQKDWTFFGHAMIWHGRLVCTARKPDCANCKLAKLCPSRTVVHS